MCAYVCVWDCGGGGVVLTFLFFIFIYLLFLLCIRALLSAALIFNDSVILG